MITVIILSKTAALLKRCIQSIVRTHASLEGIEIVIVDDGLIEQPAFSNQFKYITGSKPFCFARNVNLGIRAAQDDSDIFLMNDDTYFISANGLKILEKEIVSNTKLGIISPVFARRERTPSQRLGHLPSDHGLWIERDGYLTFAAVYLRRELLSLVGLMDEDYTGYGFEDNDYSLRARLEGYELGVSTEVTMAHGDGWGQASTTFRQDLDNRRFAELATKNKEIFIRKWGERLIGLGEQDLDKLVELFKMV
jgi:GT2 family glycosyltransferase